jgi:MFS family permease
MPEATVIGASQWYRTLDRAQWKALAASNLGWTFDGFEVFALILTVGFALQQLLEAADHRLIPAYAGVVIATTVVGWGIGGLLGGSLADYVGRKRTMIFAILAYSLMTGLSALSWDWLSFAALRFLVGVAIGSGRPARRSWPSFGPITRAARAPPLCNPGLPLAASLPPASGWWSVPPVPTRGAPCI